MTVGPLGVAVEVAGIEPASFGTEPGLLRAHPAIAFLSPSSYTGKPLTGSAAVGVPTDPAAGPAGGAFSLMPDTGSKALPG